MGNFYNYLVDRGYDREILKPLFLEATSKLTENPALKSNASDEEKRAFLHLKFHPFQISRKDIQDALIQSVDKTSNLQNQLRRRSQKGERPR